MPSTPSSKSLTSTEREEFLEKQLKSLLAVVHRDGGQYTTLVGLDASLADAEAKIAALYQERASMKRKLGSMMFGTRKP